MAALRVCGEFAGLEGLEARTLLDGDTLTPPTVFNSNGVAISAMVSQDFDRDGDQDLAIASGRRISLLLNNGDATFEKPMVLQLRKRIGEMVTGRFDADNHPDLATLWRRAAMPAIVRVIVYDEATGGLVLRSSRTVVRPILSINAGDFVGNDRDELVLAEAHHVGIWTVRTDGRVRPHSIAAERDDPIEQVMVSHVDEDPLDDITFVTRGADAAAIVVVRFRPEMDPLVFTVAAFASEGFCGYAFRQIDSDSLPDLLAFTRNVPGLGNFVVNLLHGAPFLQFESAEEIATLSDGFWELSRSFRLLGTEFIDESESRGLVISDFRTERQLSPPYGTDSYGTVFRIRPDGDATYTVLETVVGILQPGGALAANLDGEPSGPLDLAWVTFGSLVNVASALSGNTAPVVVEASIDGSGTVVRGSSFNLRGVVSDVEYVLGLADMRTTMSFVLDTNHNGEIDDADRVLAAQTPSSSTFWLQEHFFRTVTVGLDWEVGTFAVLAFATDHLGLVSGVYTLEDMLTII